mmetsp:Transcript_9290/g.32182  ORF Transcript_9290/g.32182 Transcript_9290/m.32182 type:complete len:294 (-) Transcript_9290:129-1010(-)
MDRSGRHDDLAPDHLPTHLCLKLAARRERQNSGNLSPVDHPHASALAEVLDLDLLDLLILEAHLDLSDVGQAGAPEAVRPAPGGVLRPTLLERAPQGQGERRPPAFFLPRGLLEELTRVLWDEVGVKVALQELVVLQDVAQEGHVVGQVRDMEVSQRPAHLAHGVRPVLALGDHLRDHRIVVVCHGVPLPHAAVHADAIRQLELPRPLGNPEPQKVASGRQEVLLWVLGVQPDLHRVPIALDVLLAQRELFPRRNPELQLHQIHVGHALRDGVLDLEPGVHFHEVELPRVGVH